MATAILPVEEENYIRMSLLLTGISPRAVRVLFDREFSPQCLYPSLKKEYTKLNELKKLHIISLKQWDLLFPPSRGVPDSKTFDITLMITLLRNLTPMIPPMSGFDCLPPTTATTQGADLARIKFYRNRLAHLDDAKINHDFFITSWKDATDAIVRVGGHQFQMECDNLKNKPLDRTSHTIMLEINKSNDEIRELKQSLNNLRKEIEISQQVTIPRNVRGKHQN
ncbi:E3 ubiquitin-protein ligase DZIP3-like [Mytilus galloprovincialis]|uniref:E3 ubiquitin-protein ligase DZIP3-like n=1 Tax=Mytilus galloprovincialis TaxID=29158 RepID=UPI003F7C31FA